MAIEDYRNFDVNDDADTATMKGGKWYACGICYDSEEGIFPMAVQWPNDRFQNVVMIAGPFDAMFLASKQLDDHDPEETGVAS